MCKEPEDVQRIVVRRSHLFSDAFRTFSRVLSYKMLAIALVQGQLPVCFAKPVANFLAFGSVKSDVDLDDIQEYNIIQSLKMVRAPVHIHLGS